MFGVNGEAERSWTYSLEKLSEYVLTYSVYIKSYVQSGFLCVCHFHLFLFFLFSKLILTVDSTDDTYMPKRVTVFGGEGDNLKKYNDVNIDEWVASQFHRNCRFTDVVQSCEIQWNLSNAVFIRRNLIGEVCVLEDMTIHLPIIEIRIEECRGETQNRFNSATHSGGELMVQTANATMIKEFWCLCSK